MKETTMFNKHSVEIDWGGRPLKLETGKIARQADGAVLATYGETVVLDPFHVDRGYSDLAASLRALGADVERVHDWR